LLPPPPPRSPLFPYTTLFRSRLIRQDYSRERKKPDWAVVQLQILKPLLEVRDRIGEELARRDSKDSLVPIDRDPVPVRYADSVRDRKSTRLNSSHLVISYAVF